MPADISIRKKQYWSQCTEKGKGAHDGIFKKFSDRPKNVSLLPQIKICGRPPYHMHFHFNMQNKTQQVIWR